MKVVVYYNVWNANKRIEVHYDGYGHFAVKQYIFNPRTMKRNYTGDGCLHRWRKANLVELLNDYRFYFVQ